MNGTDHQLSSVTAVMAAIDALNADDPTLFAGEPLAQFQGKRATAWALGLSPDASIPVQVATRAHHLRRWEFPRADFPAGRPGYLRWRREAKRRHRSLVTDLLQAHLWNEADTDRVGDLIERKGLGSDPDTQLVEDAACLVFLETQFDEMLTRLGHDHLVSVVAKTLKKMSPEAIAAAGTIDLSSEAQMVLQDAVTPPGITPPGITPPGITPPATTPPKGDHPRDRD